MMKDYKLFKLGFIVLFLLNIESVYSQVKHEIKINAIDFLSKTIHPSYEIITSHGKIGIELGGGMSYENERLGRPLEYFSAETFKRSKIQMQVGIKYYLPLLGKEKPLDFYLGPVLSFNKTVAYEDSYFVKLLELRSEYSNIRQNFVGQRDYGMGFQMGFRYVHKSNFLIALGGGRLFKYQEIAVDMFELAQSESIAHIKFGYQFGNKLKVESPIN